MTQKYLSLHMGSRKNLNGLPNNLVQRYFSTLFYWSGGYMADWIWNTANDHNVMDIEIDILNEGVEPNALQILPITGHLHQLRDTIQATLKSHHLPADFVMEAKFIIYISQKHKTSKLLTCQGVVIDKEGRKYIGKIYTEQSLVGHGIRTDNEGREYLGKIYNVKSLEDEGKVFPHSLLQRIMNFFKQ